MKRLTWLVGPPGAGKTTFGRVQRAAGTRVLELTDMMAPWIEPAGISRGVLMANGALVEMIRALELRPENRNLPPLLVIAGLAPEEAIFAGAPGQEEVWLLLPERSRWREQFRRRPTQGEGRLHYDDYDYAELWYERFEGWRAAGRALISLSTDYKPELVGVPPDEARTMK